MNEGSKYYIFFGMFLVTTFINSSFRVLYQSKNWGKFSLVNGLLNIKMDELFNWMSSFYMWTNFKKEIEDVMDPGMGWSPRAPFYIRPCLSNLVGLTKHTLSIYFRKELTRCFWKCLIFHLTCDLIVAIMFMLSIYTQWTWLN